MAPMGKLLGGSHRYFLFHRSFPPGGITCSIVFVRSWSTFLPKPARIPAGAALYLARGRFEMLGGELARQPDMKNFGFSILATIEELLELWGTIVFLSALLLISASNSNV
jgi:hypothetical protein